MEMRTWSAAMRVWAGEGIRLAAHLGMGTIKVPEGG